MANLLPRRAMKLMNDIAKTAVGIAKFIVFALVVVLTRKATFLFREAS